MISPTKPPSTTSNPPSPPPTIPTTDNTSEKDQHMDIGVGKIDWQNFTSTLKEFDLAPEAVLEIGTLEKTKTSLTYMKEHDVYPF